MTSPTVIQPLVDMGAGVVLIAVVAIGLIGEAFVRHRTRSAADSTLDGAARDRISRRIEEIRGSPGTRVMPADGPYRSADQELMPPGPRRRLLRDTSAVLTLFGVAALVMLAANNGGGPDGGVLGATATAEPSTARHVPRAQAATAGPNDSDTPGKPSPSPSRVATRADESRASGSRLAIVTPCRDRKDCYIYVVRRGDNLISIANWFGIDYRTLLRWNPTIRNHTLRAGDRITLPTPQR